MNELLPSLSEFTNEVPASDKTLLVVNRTGPKPLINLLSKAFSNQSITIAERHIPEGTADLVCLIEDGKVVATSPLDRL